MDGYTSQTGVTSRAHAKEDVTAGLRLPKSSSRDPPDKVPVPPATPGTSASQDLPHAAPVQKPPDKPPVPFAQNKQETSPPASTTRRGRVVQPPAHFADY